MKISQTDEVNETYWFPTPQNPGNEREHTPIQTRILNELRELQHLEQLNPLEDTNSRDQFLSNFDWIVSTIQLNAKQAVEDLLVEFHDTFARHGFLTLESIQSSKYNSHLYITEPHMVRCFLR